MVSEATEALDGDGVADELSVADFADGSADPALEEETCGLSPVLLLFEEIELELAV